MSAETDFSLGADDWVAGFADFLASDIDEYDLSGGIEQVPIPGSGTGFMLQGLNRSDDLFMFIKKQIGGLEPNRLYKIEYTIDLASNAPTGAVGVGGPPGESVFLKAGGSFEEPIGSVDEQGWIRLNVDKGNQANGGANLSVAGDIANGGEETIYRNITRSVLHSTSVISDFEGKIWLIVGTDSGFEGLTRIYIQNISAKLTLLCDTYVDCMCWNCHEGECGFVLMGCPAENDPCIATGDCCSPIGYYNTMEDCKATCFLESSSSSAESSSSSSSSEIPPVFLTGPLIIGFIDESNPNYIVESNDKQDFGKYWRQDVNYWNSVAGNTEINYLVFNIWNSLYPKPIYPKLALEHKEEGCKSGEHPECCTIPDMPIPEENVIQSFRPTEGNVTTQDAFYYHIVKSIEERYGAGIWSGLRLGGNEVLMVIDISGSMTRELIGRQYPDAPPRAIENFELFLDYKGIPWKEMSDCMNERWINWGVNIALDPKNPQPCFECDRTCYLPTVGPNPSVSNCRDDNRRIKCIDVIGFGSPSGSSCKVIGNVDDLQTSMCPYVQRYKSAKIYEANVVGKNFTQDGKQVGPYFSLDGLENLVKVKDDFNPADIRWPYDRDKVMDCDWFVWEEHNYTTWKGCGIVPLWSPNALATVGYGCIEQEGNLCDLSPINACPYADEGATGAVGQEPTAYFTAEGDVFGSTPAAIVCCSDLGFAWGFSQNFLNQQDWTEIWCPDAYNWHVEGQPPRNQFSIACSNYPVNDYSRCQYLMGKYGPTEAGDYCDRIEIYSANGERVGYDVRLLSGDRCPSDIIGRPQDGVTDPGSSSTCETPFCSPTPCQVDGRQETFFKHGHVKYRAFAISCDAGLVEITNQVFQEDGSDIEYLEYDYREKDQNSNYSETIHIKSRVDAAMSCEGCENLCGEREPLLPFSNPVLYCDPKVICPAPLRPCEYTFPEYSVGAPNLFDASSWSNLPDDPTWAVSKWRNYLDKATIRWMRLAKFDQQVFQAIKNMLPTWNGIKLNSVTMFNDPNSGTIAACGPYQYVDLVSNQPGVKFNTVSFDLYINQAFENAFDDCDWVNIITHELGHALGIGVYWDEYFAPQGAIVPVENLLRGAAYGNAQDAYNQITKLNRGFVPLEDNGGPGTVGGHWEIQYRPAPSSSSSGMAEGSDVDYYGFWDELMVGYFDRGIDFRISRLSIKALVDFGYVEVNPGESEGEPTLTTNYAKRALDTRIKLNCSCPIHAGILPRKIGTIAASDK